MRTLKGTAIVLLVKGEELARGGTDLREEEAEAPDLLLILETELTAKLELSVDALLLVGATRRGHSGTIYTICERGRHGAKMMRAAYNCAGQRCAAYFTDGELYVEKMQREAQGQGEVKDDEEAGARTLRQNRGGPLTTADLAQPSDSLFLLLSLLICIENGQGYTLTMVKGP